MHKEVSPPHTKQISRESNRDRSHHTLVSHLTSADLPRAS